MIELKTQPLHYAQADEIKGTIPKRRARWWEMGCGKTWPTIVEAAILEDAGEIDGMFVLAPNGVHENWVTDELPAHLPDELMARTRVHQWWTSRAGSRYLKTIRNARERGQVGHRESADATLHHDGFSILAMSYNGMMTMAGQEYAKAFLKKKRCLYVCDESHLGIKTPGAKTTIRVRASSRYAEYRRVLTGTVVADKPFDVYSQSCFVDPTCWQHLGIGDAEGFRTHFGIFEPIMGRDGKPITRGRRNKVAEKLVEYQNLEQMNEVLAAMGSRVLKAEVLPDLPPKNYTKRYFELTPEQKRVYDAIRREFQAEWNGNTLTAPLAVTRLLRLQQVCSGYLPSDEDRDLTPIDGKNPRLNLLFQTLEECGNLQGIIWAKYTNDIDMIMRGLRERGMSAVRYDGQTNERQMSEAKEAFKSGAAQWFVGNPVKGGTGLTLVCAKVMVYYNTDFKLNPRLQSEDRFHRYGQLDPVQIVDLAAHGSVDNYIIKTLREKREVAEVVMGDPVAEWI